MRINIHTGVGKLPGSHPPSPSRTVVAPNQLFCGWATWWFWLDGWVSAMNGNHNESTASPQQRHHHRAGSDLVVVVLGEAEHKVIENYRETGVNKTTRGFA